MTRPDGFGSVHPVARRRGNAGEIPAIVGEFLLQDQASYAERGLIGKAFRATRAVRVAPDDEVRGGILVVTGLDLEGLLVAGVGPNHFDEIIGLHRARQ